MSRPMVLFPLLVAVSSVCFADHHETSTKKEFKEFCDLQAGRWMVDTTLIADWPGMKEKKGDRIKGYATYTLTVDGSALEGTEFNGTGILKVIWAYDESSKKILAMTVMPGVTTTFVIWKKSDRVFSWRATGGGLSGSGEHIFSQDGKTMTLVGTDIKVGGEDVDDLNDVYHKVSK